MYRTPPLGLKTIFLHILRRFESNTAKYIININSIGYIFDVYENIENINAAMTALFIYTVSCLYSTDFKSIYNIITISRHGIRPNSIKIFNSSL